MQCCLLVPGKAHKESSSRKHNQKAPEDISFIREKTYTLPITLERELRIRARTKRRKKKEETRSQEESPLTPGGAFLSRPTGSVPREKTAMKTDDHNQQKS